MKQYGEKTKAIARIVFGELMYSNLGFDPLPESELDEYREQTERVINGGQPNDGMGHYGPIIRAASEAWDEAIEWMRDTQYEAR